MNKWACTSLILVPLALVGAACSGSGDGSAGDSGTPATGSNVFANPDFESGRDPWFSLKPPDFELAHNIVHSGGSSALLRMRDGPEDSDAKIYYLVQEIAPGELPEVLAGYYRVENWNKGTPKQYLQFVVVVFGPDNMVGAPNFQIRYLLAGIDEPPFAIGNAKFVFLSEEDPVTGEWVRFERNVKEDFLNLWGAVPEGFDNIRVLFEVRWDDKIAGQGAPQADVYYDDLYWGPADGTG